MNVYTRNIFPRLMESSLSLPEAMALRGSLLAPVQGQTLEIGIGGGLNLFCYPPGLRHITAVDVHDQMLQTAAERAKQAGMTVDFHPISAERLPFADASFDSVVSTWTLCSIPNVAQALAEVHRVLKPNGQLYFLEHGLSPNRWIRICQNGLNPVQKIIAAGCHLNRDIPSLLQYAGLVADHMRTFYLRCLPPTHGYSYMGSAGKE